MKNGDLCVFSYYFAFLYYVEQISQNIKKYKENFYKVNLFGICDWVWC